MDHAPDAAACWEANAETWTRQVRAGYDIYRDHLNTPAFLATASAADRAASEPFHVPYVHLTLSQWIDGIIDAGLSLSRLGEPMASEETARSTPDLADTRVAPLFLHVQATNPVISA